MPTGWPADQDLVARHELAAGLEEQLVLVAVVVAEEHHDEHDAATSAPSASNDGRA